MSIKRICKKARVARVARVSPLFMGIYSTLGVPMTQGNQGTGDQKLSDSRLIPMCNAGFHFPIKYSFSYFHKSIADPHKGLKQLLLR
jgi:hypothetical protein